MKYLNEFEKAEEAMEKFIHSMENDGVIVFDTETNGRIPGPDVSVLSVSAILLQAGEDKSFFEVDRFSRFYYPVEKYEQGAIGVNGLSSDVVDKLREESNATYPRFFKDDPFFKEWCAGCTSFVGHNLQFDLKMVNCLPDTINVFDTMLTNIEIVKSEWNDYRGQWKWPRLLETAEYYKIRLIDEDLHGSMYDVEITLNIFNKMLKATQLRWPKFKPLISF